MTCNERCRLIYDGELVDQSIGYFLFLSLLFSPKKKTTMDLSSALVEYKRPLTGSIFISVHSDLTLLSVIRDGWAPYLS